MVKVFLWFVHSALLDSVCYATSSVRHESMQSFVLMQHF